MVEVTQYHTLIADKVSSLVDRVLSQSLLLVTHTVRLNVTLVANIDTILIAEVVPKWRVWIVASTNCVDVELLHNLDITNHILASYVVTGVRSHLVTVCTLNEYRFAVYEQLRILNLHLTETYLECSSLNSVAIVENLNCQLIESWSLSTPSCYLTKVPALINLTLNYSYNLLLNLLAAWRNECKAEILNALCSGDIEVEVTISVVVVQISNELHILDMLLVTCVDVAVATNTRKTEEILILEVRAITPTIDLHSEEVLLTRLYKLGNLELSLQLRVLAITYILTVDPQREVRCSRTDVYIDLLAFPLCRNLHIVTIRTHCVLLGWSVRRILLVELVPRVAAVLVNRHTIAVHLPQTRNRHLAPLRVVEVWQPEVLRLSISCILSPIEVPNTANRTIER